MTEAEWKASEDPEAMILALPVDRYQSELRLFAVACVRRVWTLLSDACQAALKASEAFAKGSVAERELAAAVVAADGDAEAACPGHSAPDARAYAMSAAVDASSIWPRTASNVLAASSCAASAAACAAAEADELCYNATYQSVLRLELAEQARLLRALVLFPPA